MKKQLKSLFICNTIYQVIVATAIATQTNTASDIIITNHTNNAKPIAEKIMQNLSIYTKCAYIETKDFCFNYDTKINEQDIIKDIQANHFLQHYDYIYCANWERFTILTYTLLKKYNRNLLLQWYEDGLGTYCIDKKLFNKPNFLKKIYNAIIKIPQPYKDVKNIWLFQPHLMKLTNKHITISKINNLCESAISFLNYIFEYENLTDNYNHRIIFFEDGYKDFSDKFDISKLEIIASKVGKQNIFIKRHPRDTINKYTDYGFLTNENTVVPSEMIILNNDFSNTMFVTVYSQAIITASILFNKKVKSIILSNLDSSQNTKLDPYFEFLYENIYKNNPDIYFIPKSDSELLSLFENILN